MKHMGCFNHYQNRQQIVIFGGSHANSGSHRCYRIDLEKQSMEKYGSLTKSDKFSNHIFFKKDELLYVMGESFLHMYDLTKNKWSEEVYPLNQSVLV